MSYHIFTHFEYRATVSIQRRKSKKWLSIVVVLYEKGGLSLRFWQQSFSATSTETQRKKWIDEWIEGEGRYWSCFMSSPVWRERRRRGAATCVFVPRSSITTLMSKVTINLSIKSKTNKRQKMMHHPNTASPTPPPPTFAANKNNDNQIDLSKRTQALLQTGVVGGWWR